MYFCLNFPGYFYFRRFPFPCVYRCPKGLRAPITSQHSLRPPPADNEFRYSPLVRSFNAEDSFRSPRFSLGRSCPRIARPRYGPSPRESLFDFMLTSPVASARRYKFLSERERERERARILIPWKYLICRIPRIGPAFSIIRDVPSILQPRRCAAWQRFASSPLRGFFNFSSVFCSASHEMNTRWMHGHLAQVAKIKERASINPPFPRLCSSGRFSAPLCPFPGRTRASAHTYTRPCPSSCRFDTPLHTLAPSFAVRFVISARGIFFRSPL